MPSMDGPINYVCRPRCKRLNQHIAAFVASLGGFALGVAIGWHSSAAGTVKTMLSNSSTTEIRLVEGGLYMGASSGALLLPLLFKYISHITAMYLTIPFFIIGWTFVCLFDRNVALLVIGRAICGMCGAVHSVVAPLYISEIADKDIRGRLLSFFHLLINCGILYAYAVAHLIDEDETVWRYSLTCAVSCIVINAIVFIPDSPIYLLSKSDEHNAYQSVRWLKSKHFVAEEMRELQNFIFGKASPRSLLSLLTNRHVLQSMFACFCVMVTQQLSGINVIIPNALMIFDVGGSGDMSGSQQTIVVGVVQIVSCIFAAILVDIVGRSLMLTVSSITTSFLLVFLASYYRVKDAEFEETYYWVPPVLIILLFASFNVGIGPISWAVLSDSFPEEMKITAASIFAAFSWLLSLLATTYFVQVQIALGMDRTLYLFAIFCLMGSILAKLFVVDTHGKSLNEIQKWFRPMSLSPSPDETPSVPNQLFQVESEMYTNM